MLLIVIPPLGVDLDVPSLTPAKANAHPEVREAPPELAVLSSPTRSPMTTNRPPIDHEDDTECSEWHCAAVRPHLFDAAVHAGGPNRYNAVRCVALCAHLTRRKEMGDGRKRRKKEKDNAW
ncbi:hypothetical protein MBLNU457_3243t1 [Dothideomycetes sp. NU457]